MLELGLSKLIFPRVFSTSYVNDLALETGSCDEIAMNVNATSCLLECSIKVMKLWIQSGRFMQAGHRIVILGKVSGPIFMLCH